MILLDAFLKDGYALAEEFGLTVPEEKERSLITQTVISAARGHQKAARLAAACEAYYVFRKLHIRRDTGVEAATLLGDYFFSVFSRLILPFENSALIDDFSEQLRKNCENSVKDEKEIDLEEYLNFVETICVNL